MTEPSWPKKGQLKQFLVSVNTKFSGINIWAVTRQNQQCGCLPSKDSDQPGHPPSLIRVFAVGMKKAWVGPYLPIERTAKTLIRLGGCPGWSESSMCAHSFCWFCHEAAHRQFMEASICSVTKTVNYKTSISCIWHQKFEQSVFSSDSTIYIVYVVVQIGI